MSTDSRAALEGVCRLIAIQAALLVAAIHLLWAVPRLSPSLLSDPVADSRPFLFVPAAVLLVAIAAALFRGHRYRRLSTLGGGTLAALFSGYILWVSDPLRTALAGDPLALVAAVVELVGVAAFAVLYYLHHPDRFGSSVDTSQQ